MVLEMHRAALCAGLVGIVNVVLCAYILSRGNVPFLVAEERRSALHLIVLTVDRPRSLNRLLDSLKEADFAGDAIDLDIVVDRPKGGPNSLWLATLDIAHATTWPHGRKAIRVREQFAGLRKQWFEAWIPHSDSERALILEDDVQVSSLSVTWPLRVGVSITNTLAQVSPYFWRWLKAAHDRFESDDSVAGFTLQRAQVCVNNDECHGRTLGGGPVGDGESFSMPLVGSWGFSPKARHWDMFISWASRYRERPSLPNTIISDWYRSAEAVGRCPGPNCMWTILHQVYTARRTDRMTIYFKGPSGTALAINNQVNCAYPFLCCWKLTFTCLFSGKGSALRRGNGPRCQAAPHVGRQICRQFAIHSGGHARGRACRRGRPCAELRRKDLGAVWRQAGGRRASRGPACYGQFRDARHV